jgi:hypothetical protein
LRFFIGRRGLPENVGVRLLLVAPEVLGSGDAANVAVDALDVDVVLSAGVLGELVAGIGHGKKLSERGLWQKAGFPGRSREEIG